MGPGSKGGNSQLGPISLSRITAKILGLAIFTHQGLFLVYMGYSTHSQSDG
jgi:hypothetical protein